MEEILQNVMTGGITPLSLKDGRRVPAPLEFIVLRAMALSPERRYPSVQALREDIIAYQNGFATVAENAGLSTLFLLWLKRNRKNPTWFYGLGYWTRGNAEICLLATKGKPKRQSAGVHQFIISPIEQHSKKPDEARQKILALMGDLPRLELFARQKAPGWDVWGNEIASDITLAERRNDGLCECAEGLEQD